MQNVGEYCKFNVALANTSSRITMYRSFSDAILCQVKPSTGKVTNCVTYLAKSSLAYNLWKSGWRISLLIVLCRAFSFSGRLKVTIPTRPFVSVKIISYGTALSPFPEPDFTYRLAVELSESCDASGINCSDTQLGCQAHEIDNA